jgi:hypothetical protein
MAITTAVICSICWVGRSIGRRPRAAAVACPGPYHAAHLLSTLGFRAKGSAIPVPKVAPRAAKQPALARRIVTGSFIMEKIEP